MYIDEVCRTSGTEGLVVRTRERDAFLSGQWFASGSHVVDFMRLPSSRRKQYADARGSILLEAYVYARRSPGRWIRYSRRHDAYTVMRRIAGSVFAYRNVVGPIDELTELRLFQNHSGSSREYL